jgi:ankyrin repeat protein
MIGRVPLTVGTPLCSLCVFRQRAAQGTPNVLGQNGHTPILWGTTCVHPQLLPFEPPPLVLLQYGRTPLHIAVSHGCKEVVGLLLDAGAAVNAATKVRPPPLATGDWGAQLPL